MNRIVTLSAVALATAMLVPSALAGWGSVGGAEPDSGYDVGHGFMWSDAPGTATAQVYFNVYNAEGTNGGVAPNSAILQSRVSTVGEGAWRSVLGVWADCNQDGYVGFAGGALIEYRAEASAAAGFPVNTDICPVTPDDAAHAGTIHNDGGWITELIPIAPASIGGTDTTELMANANNYRLIPDAGIKVWGDLHTAPVTPGGPLVPSDHCRQVSIVPPFGHGDVSHTGGIIQHLVCVESTRAPTPHDLYNTGVADDPTGIVQTLPDPRSLYQPGGPLDQPTFGTEQSCKDGQDVSEKDCHGGSNSIVWGEQDCSADPITVSDPATGTPAEGGVADPGDIQTVRPPGTLQPNAQGTIPATVNETNEELLGDCDTSNDSGGDFYGNFEASDSGATYASDKTQADMSFGFQGVMGRSTCDDVSIDPNGDPLPELPVVTVPGSGGLTCGRPSNGGQPVHAVGILLLTSDEWWNGVTYLGTQPSVGAPNAETKDSLSVAPDTFRADYYTFYATVTASGLRTPGGVGTYGAEWCTQGIGRNAHDVYGWNCDPANWNLDPTTGAKLNERFLGLVGGSYNLRDTDCYDTTLVGAGSSLNPTGQDVGGRSVAAASDPAHGCA